MQEDSLMMLRDCQMLLLLFHRRPNISPMFHNYRVLFFYYLLETSLVDVVAELRLVWLLQLHVICAKCFRIFTSTVLLICNVLVLAAWALAAGAPASTCGDANLLNDITKP